MSEKLVTIAAFRTLIDATFAKSTLEAEGIKVALADVATVQTAWHLSMAVGGIKLQVLESDARRAVSILEADESVPADKRQLWPDETRDIYDPDFDEQYDDLYVSPTDKLVKRAFLCALLGILWFPLQIYSIWLLLRIAFISDPLTSANKRKVVLTVIIDSLVVILFVHIYLSMSQI